MWESQVKALEQTARKLKCDQQSSRGWPSSQPRLLIRGGTEVQRECEGRGGPADGVDGVSSILLGVPLATLTGEFCSHCSLVTGTSSQKEYQEERSCCNFPEPSKTTELPPWLGWLSTLAKHKQGYNEKVASGSPAHHITFYSSVGGTCL